MSIPLVLAAEFDYVLPEEKIAQHPLPLRDESKLLIYQPDAFIETQYKQIAEHIPSDSIMVFNNSKVIPARLLFLKPSGGSIELFCLEPKDKTPTEALIDQESSTWICMIGGLKKWKTDQPLYWNLNDDVQLEAHFINKHAHGFEILFKWQKANYTFGEIINQLGQMPIPPYLLRKAEAEDSVRYQTTYATQAGSVAAPTAGLHFTEAIFEDLKAKDIQAVMATLHVGAGTFKPVSASHAHEHEMHAEWTEVTQSFIKTLCTNQSITSVGTTSLRTLESIYWYAIEAKKVGHCFDASYVLPQFCPYENNATLSKNELMTWLLNQMVAENLNTLTFKTQLMILPSYRFKIANRLVSNFHQPKSTLLMLISAATHGDWRRLYDFALTHDFRFLSYGDGCMIELAN